MKNLFSFKSINKNTTNTTSTKGVTTMKKTNGIKTRILAGILSAVTIFSVGAMSLTSASAATPSANTDAVVYMDTKSAMVTAANNEEKPIRIENGKIILDNDMNKVKDITAKTIFAIISEIPGGKFFTPTLMGVLDSYVGTVDKTQLKLDEINGKLNILFEKMDKMEQTIKNLLQNELKMTSFYTALVNFKADSEYLSRKINETMNSGTLSNVDKLAKIGSLVGSYKDWKNNFDKSLSVLNTYIKDTSLGSNTSIFDVVYNSSCANVMFGNEAINKAKPVCEAIVQTYTAGCASILECLGAQLYVNNLSDDMRAQINSKYLREIDASDEEIINEIQTVSKQVVGECDNSGYDNSNTIAGLCEKTFKSKSKTALVNHGLCNINLKADLFTKDFKDIPKECNAGDDSKKEADKQKDWFNNNVVKGQITGNYVKDIAAYAASKGKTIRQLLDDNGFKTSNINKDTYIITEEAFTKCYSSSYNGFEDKSDAIFKGINIDAKLTLDKNGKVSDSEVKFWKIGWEGVRTWFSFTVKRWNSNFNGNCCRFQML